MAHPMSQEVKSLHKKLVPGNIIMAVVGLIAAMCSLFMPWLDVRLSINAKQLATMLTEPTAQIREYSGVTLVNDSTETDASEDDIASLILLEAISSMPDDALSIPINIYPMKLYAAATGSEQEVAEFIVSTVGKDGIVEEMNKIVRNIIPVVMNVVITIIIEQTVEEIMVEENLPEEDRITIRSIMDAHLNSIATIITTLVGTGNTPSNPEKAKQELVSFLDDIEQDEDLNTFFEGGLQIPKEECIDIFNNFVDAGTKDGKFDVYTLLKNFDQIDFDFEAEDFTGNGGAGGNETEGNGGTQSGGGEQNGNSQGGNGNIDIFPDKNEGGNDNYNKNEDNNGDASPDRKDEYGKPNTNEEKPIKPGYSSRIVKAIVSTMAEETTPPIQDPIPDEGNSGNEEIGELADVLGMLQDPTTALTNLLLESGINLYQIQPILLVLFVLLMGVPAALWLLFAIMAIVHIFTEKKITATWYVKMFGFTSALILCVLNLVPKLILSFVGDAATAQTLSAISIKFLGSGVVVAICWAALVLLGWFYYNPIKRKIKHTLRNEKYALAHGGYPAPVSNLPPQSFTPFMPTETPVDDDEYLDEEVDEPIVESKKASSYKPDVSAYTNENEPSEETEILPEESAQEIQDSEHDEEETFDEVPQPETTDEE